MVSAKSLIRLPLILLLFQQVSCDWKPDNRQREAQCKTQECEAWGKEYKNNMDTHTNPCQDFYTFTCGNWHKNHAGPKYAPDWSVLDVLNFDVTSIIRQTLESYNSQLGGNKAFRRAKELYETCINIPEYPRREASDIAREILKIGRVPMTPLWDIHNKYLKLSGESAFFRIKIFANRPSEGMPVLMVMEPWSGYGSIHHEETWKPPEEQAYKDFLFLIMKSLKLTGSDSLIKERIERVFDFRKKLDQVIKRNLVKPPDNFNPLTGLQLDMWFLDTLHDQTNTQDIPWSEVIEALLQNIPVHMRHARKLIVMRQKEYFLELMDLLEDVSEEILGNHMEIYFVERHLIFNEDMYKLLEATSIEPHGLLHYIREKYYPRWRTCIDNHNMQETLEKLLFYKWFPQESSKILRQLNGGIKAAIENQMKESKWLDQPTRGKIIEKLNKLEEWIAFPPWVTGDTISKDEAYKRDKKEILKPNASLNIKHNLLYVHAALLLPPMFSPTIPALYNYASIGTTLGHELYHIIDDCGGYQEGNKKILWWPPEMRSKCLSKKILFINEYNKITDREFKNHYNVDVKSDTTRTFLENFPDVMGLGAAFNAYKVVASKEKSVCKTLPHFEMYSCDQMFFIAFANTYCGYYSQKSANDKLETWQHSIDRVRINGAVAQSESFGRVFGCTIGSPMNPKEKLNLWQ